MPPKGALGEVAALFAKLGFIAFGGPAAHIALMRDEIVKRRKWVTEQEFLDLLGASNLIPGPTSTELAIYLGYVRAGWRGLVLAGVLFIAPASLIVLVLAWSYVHYGTTPQASSLLYGIKPVIIAVVAQAMWGLGRTAIRGPLLAVVGVLVLALYLLGVNEIVLLFGGGLLVMLLRHAERMRRDRVRNLLVAPFVGALTAATAAPLTAATTAPFVAGVSLSTLFWTFLKIGAVLYGSGYVLLAFLRNDFVVRLRWLTDQQLIDAVAVGQFTPGPVFTTATFVGYVVGGLGGAALATIAIFLPSFVFVAAIYPVIPRVRGSRWASALLDGVNVAALGLMAAVTWQLARAAIFDLTTAILAATAALLLIRLKVNSVWLIAAGAAVGILKGFLAP